MFNESYFVPIIIIAFIIFFPLGWKENNSWWFVIIKFWLVILPVTVAALGIFAIFAGPALALYGLFNWDAFPVTLLYVYVIIGFLIINSLPDKIKQKLETI